MVKTMIIIIMDRSFPWKLDKSTSHTKLLKITSIQKEHNSDGFDGFGTIINIALQLD